MNLITKVASVGSAVGIVGGAVALTNHLYKGFRDIRERLAGFGYQVLKFDGDADEWSKLDLAYKAESTSSKKFSGTVTDLKEQCKIILTRGPNDDIYNLARRWCVKEDSIKSILERNKYTKLEKTSSKSTERSKWEEKINAMKDAPTETIKIDIDFNTGDTNSWITALEKACDALMEDSIKTHNQDEFEKKYIQAKSWCAVKQEGSNK
ncbi:hypothetical protein A6V39_00795 [Candidatus Mycoplasma haematobovis]|uniref:Uncharacterized protein n=1 Tax=Candidatus Mycoplasma haematobovis TaxID=432608 RepID=A0A1A9QFU7_9MOLU|nr:hypothetical protein [Candidatus Mycoplasma haematobovis]OAL10589.1 hypothetical protein A6V39_00795 [Candidatus Mycoplasma haematobovis]